MTPSTRRAPLIAALAALLLSACAAEADPVPIFEEPSATPTPSASAAPEKETRRQFLQRWVNADREMQNTGKPGTYLELSHECDPCEEFAERVVSMYEGGGNISTGPMTVERIRPADEGGHIVWVSSEPTTYTEFADAQEEYLPGGTAPYRVVTSKVDGSWGVTFWVPREGDE